VKRAGPKGRQGEQGANVMLPRPRATALRQMADFGRDWRARASPVGLMHEFDALPRRIGNHCDEAP